MPCSSSGTSDVLCNTMMGRTITPKSGIESCKYGKAFTPTLFYITA